MALGGIHSNIGLYGQRPPKRPGQATPSQRPEDQEQRPHNAQNEGQGRRAVTQYQQHLPSAEQVQQFKDKSANDDSFSRYLGMSLGATRAINAYHQMETQQRREEITQMLGLDIYV